MRKYFTCIGDKVIQIYEKCYIETGKEKKDSHIHMIYCDLISHIFYYINDYIKAH